MYRRLLRITWRILTALLVVGLSYLTAFVLLPYFDQRMPAFFAFTLAYGVFAYVILPFVSRFWHIVFRPNHIPRYVVTPDGWPADPVNIAIIASSKKQFIAAMRRAGWYEADPATWRNMLHEAQAIIFNKNYFTAPFSNFYLFGRKFDIGFQRPIAGKASPRHRHHVRFWQLIEEPEIDKNNHFEYWLTRLQHLIGRRHKVWIGAAIEDTSPVGIRWRNLQLTHHNSREHTRERDFIVDTLMEAKAIRSVRIIQEGEPFKMRSQNIGTSFVIDGNIKVVTLKTRLFS